MDISLRESRLPTKSEGGKKGQDENGNKLVFVVNISPPMMFPQPRLSVSRSLVILHFSLATINIPLIAHCIRYSCEADFNLNFSQQDPRHDSF